MDGPTGQRVATRTKQSILDAAKRAFSEGGSQVGVRDIASRARVNPALINRYFGSKEGLLKQVMCSVPVDFAGVLRKDRANFGTNVARGLLANCQTGEEFDPTLVMLRSLGNTTAAGSFAGLLATWVDPLAEELGGTDCKLRADLILSAIAGFQVFARVFATRGIAEAADDHVTALLGATIQSYVDASSS